MNPRPNAFKADDDALLASLDRLWNPGLFDPRNAGTAWLEGAATAVEQARELLIREWQVTKRVPRQMNGE